MYEIEIIAWEEDVTDAEAMIWGATGIYIVDMTTGKTLSFSEYDEAELESLGVEIDFNSADMMAAK